MRRLSDEATARAYAAVVRRSTRSGIANRMGAPRVL